VNPQFNLLCCSFDSSVFRDESFFYGLVRNVAVGNTNTNIQTSGICFCFNCSLICVRLAVVLILEDAGLLVYPSLSLKYI